MVLTKNSSVTKTAFVLCLILVAAFLLQGCKTSSSKAALRARSGVAVDGLEMSLLVLPSAKPEDPEFEVSIQNVGARDVSLNLGCMLANGKTMIPLKITLLLVDETGKQWSLSLPSPNIAGRADDYVVPLRAGSTYSVRFRLDQVGSPATKEFRIKLPSGKCEFTAEFEGTPVVRPNLDMQGMELMKFWLGKLRSNTVTIQNS